MPPKIQRKTWVHKVGEKDVNEITVKGVMTLNEPIPPTDDEQGQMFTRLTVCVTSSREWITHLLTKEFSDVRGSFMKYFVCAGLSEARCRDTYAIALEKIRKIKRGLDEDQEV